MPPKKGKDKPAKKKEKEKEDLGPPVPTEKELQLQTELDELQEKLTILKSEVESLRKENDFLNEEAGQTRTESHEYMSFMAKKTNKRQTAIISLSDKNENELQKISAEKKEMLKQYEERKEDLKEMLLEKEHYLAKANMEFADLSEYRELRSNQLQRIKELEQEVIRKRAEYSDTIQQMKTTFLAERAEYTAQSEERIRELTREANKKAVICLDEHSNRIKQENRALRTELMELLKQSKLLNEHKKRLETQHAELVREKQYSEDIKRLRGQKQIDILQRKEAAVAAANANRASPRQSVKEKSNDSSRKTSESSSKFF